RSYQRTYASTWRSLPAIRSGSDWSLWEMALTENDSKRFQDQRFILSAIERIPRLPIFYRGARRYFARTWEKSSTPCLLRETPLDDPRFRLPGAVRLRPLWT